MNPINSDPLERIRNVDEDKDGSILKNMGVMSGTKLIILKVIVVASGRAMDPSFKKHGFESHYEQWYGLIFSFPR